MGTPRAQARRAMAKPAPSSPSRFVAGTRTFEKTISQCPSGEWCCMMGILRTSVTPGVSMGSSSMLCRACLSTSSSPLRHITISNSVGGRPGRTMRPLRPTGRPQRTRAAEAADEATSGSDMANADRISPSSRGRNQRWFCSGVANRCSNSILPVSGALQLNTSEAQGRRPRLGQRRDSRAQPSPGSHPADLAKKDQTPTSPAPETPEGRGKSLGHRMMPGAGRQHERSRSSNLAQRTLGEIRNPCTRQ